MNIWLEPARITRAPSSTSTPVRIGDAERDRAIDSLGGHFAAGRISRDELDERVDQAMAAKFDRELATLFADLPQPVAAPAPTRSARPIPSPIFALLPLLFITAIVLTAVLAGAPWLLWSLFWVFMFTGFAGRRARAHAHFRR